MLNFDEATTRMLEEVYQGADVSARRRANFDVLAPAPGEHILDLGCGNGLMTLELSRAVGPTGRVSGLDPSPDMLAAARQRCAGRDNVTLSEGIADDLPFEDGQIDKAISVQVFEYIADRRPALRDLRRVLRPGGRLVIGDINWDSLAWFSDNPDRMARMIDNWDGHLAERCVPAHLPAELRDCGFAVDTMRPFPICDIILRPDGLANMMMQLVKSYALSTKAVSADEADAWLSEQIDLAEQGRFFFSITHFVCVATAV